MSGILSVVVLLRGMGVENRYRELFSDSIILWGGIAVVISLICYVRYYHLDNRACFYDGMIPLLMAALVMLGISVVMIIRR